MISSLKYKSVLSLFDLSVEEIETVLKTAETLKMQRRIGQTVKTLEGKVIALIFQKPSTRTKVSFLSGISQLGGTPLYLDGKDLQLGRGETIEDTARVLSRYVDAIVARVYDHSDLEGLAEHGSIPVINALSDDYHPCQALADILTIYEKVNKVKGIKLANFSGLKITYTGDGDSNMAHETLLLAAKTGMDIALASHKDYQPNEQVMAKVNEVAKISGSTIVITDDPLEAANNSDILYTDALVSMGEDEIGQKKLKDLIAYQLDSKMIEAAKADAIVMHPLPAIRGAEISAEAMESPRAVIWDQAENRLHVQKALLSLVLG